ncbi:pseudouridine synthase [Acidaminobacter hydrogenoformans]|uniref:Pseudouridine synthase n=1 Tax=Acidaminobacter hydrogenoformans DSM 2784 TaxID=1120920 RepID=A0A1G5S5P7_9FIRM|nr:pseudouridine synthase [Acidaminobacter hydrogenoformans]SCZ81200.1 ribosomal large subunit pseudouridine synthase F [Acidaminobacter hydrogenoformans DSM 2784]
MRLNVFISSTGICSRREADRLILEGKVKVNGVLAGVGTQVSEEDHVEVEGRHIKKRVPNVYIALNKPVGITCTTERHIKGNIIDFVNHPYRIFPVGRLDKDSEGLIILTNDGGIVNEVLREENAHEKEYLVQVNRPVTPEFVKAMSNGIRIYNPVRKQHTKTKPCKVVRVSEYGFRIVLSQGLNRQIRRMCEAMGYEVIKLKRTRIMSLRLGDLRVGQWRPLTKEEIAELRHGQLSAPGATKSDAAKHKGGRKK